MSRFRKLAQTIWHCQYHIVWVPKYRFKILTGKVAKIVENCVRAFSEQQSCEVLELNVQIDHVHIVVMVPSRCRYRTMWVLSKGERQFVFLTNSVI